MTAAAMGRREARDFEDIEIDLPGDALLASGITREMMHEDRGLTQKQPY
jgi:hypothetical protein